MLVVALTAGLEIPKGPRFWLVHDRQQSLVLAAVGLEGGNCF